MRRADPCDVARSYRYERQSRGGAIDDAEPPHVTLAYRIIGWGSAVGLAAIAVLCVLGQA